VTGLQRNTFLRKKKRIRIFKDEDKNKDKESLPD
jgi:hypothetical protein